MSPPARSPGAREWPIVERPAVADAVLAGVSRFPVRAQLLVGPAGAGKTVLASAVADATGRTIVPVLALAELAGVPLGAFGPALARLGVDAEPGRAVPSLMAAVGRAADRMLLLVDDLPRLDAVSAAAVYQLVRAFGVPVVATARLGEPLPGPAQRMSDEGLLDRHEIGGLGLAEVGEVLERRLDGRVAYADVRRLARRTDGNPLYLRMLVEQAERAHGIRAEGDVLRIDEGDPPADVVDAIASRIAELRGEERRMLRLVALLQPAPRPVLARDPAERSALTRLEARGLVVVAPGERLVQVAHPLVAELLEREPDVAGAAAVAVARLRESGSDGDRLHAVRIEQRSGEPPLGELAWAAEYAYGTGDFALAAELAGAVLVREADQARRCAALVTRGSAASVLGDLDAADRDFAAAEAIAETADELALIAVRRGEHLSYRRYDVAAAVAQAERIRTRIADVATGRRDAEPGESLRRLEASVQVVGEVPVLGRVGEARPALAARAAVAQTFSRAARGDVASLRAAVESLEGTGLAHADPLASTVLGVARFAELAATGRVADATAYLEARRADAEDSVGVFTLLLACLRQFAGRVAESERLAALAADQLRWRDGLGMLGVALAVQASAVARLGRVAEAQRLLDAMTAGQRHARHAGLPVAEAQAWIRVHEGDVDGAVDLVRTAVHRVTERGAVLLATPAVRIPIRLGALDAAVELAETITAGCVGELPPVAAFRDTAIALRDRDTEALPDAPRRLMECGQPPTVLDAALLGIRMRPRAEVRRKLELLAGRARAGIDEPPLQQHEAPILTPRELEVARAAAARERAKEIAARLGTSPRTVETQLQSAFRKLGVSSRDELRDALADIGLLDDPI